jgi:hypothetical protein
MKFVYYISSIKSQEFINQRQLALKLEDNIKLIDIDNHGIIKKVKEIFFFTLCNKSLKKFLKIYKINQNINKVVCFDVIHAAIYFGSSLFNNKLYFKINEIIKKLKLKIKLYIYSEFRFSTLILKIQYKYILTNSRENNIFNNKLSKKKLIQCRPYLNKSLKKEELFHNKIKKKKNIFFFDSYFPLHPDYFIKNKENVKIAKILINYYLVFLNKHLSNKQNRYIFLHPRTFNLLKKNISFVKYLKKFSDNFYFYNGVSSFLNFLNKKGNIIVQPGTQLAVLKRKIKILNNKIKVLNLDDTFLKKIQLLKNLYRSQYLKNYEKIEIKPFKKLDNKKFINYS